MLVVCANGCTEDVARMLKLSLTEFSLPKFYQLFGISKVKSAAVSAFRSSYRPGDRSFAYTPPEQERVSLQSLEVITDALLEIMEVWLSSTTISTYSQLGRVCAEKLAYSCSTFLGGIGQITFLLSTYDGRL